MARRFKLKTFDETKEIEAFSFAEQGSFVVFAEGNGGQVYAIPTSKVVSIERVPEQK